MKLCAHVLHVYVMQLYQNLHKADASPSNPGRECHKPFVCNDKKTRKPMRQIKGIN